MRRLCASRLDSGVSLVLTKDRVDRSLGSRQVGSVAESRAVGGSNSATAAASAAFSFGASTAPRYCPRFLMIETRQLRSLVAVGFFLAAFMSRPCCRKVCHCAKYPLRVKVAVNTGLTL